MGFEGTPDFGRGGDTRIIHFDEFEFGLDRDFSNLFFKVAPRSSHFIKAAFSGKLVCPERGELVASVRGPIGPLFVVSFD